MQKLIYTLLSIILSTNVFAGNYDKPVSYNSYVNDKREKRFKEEYENYLTPDELNAIAKRNNQIDWDGIAAFHSKFIRENSPGTPELNFGAAQQFAKDCIDNNNNPESPYFFFFCDCIEEKAIEHIKLVDILIIQELHDACSESEDCQHRIKYYNDDIYYRLNKERLLSPVVKFEETAVAYCVDWEKVRKVEVKSDSYGDDFKGRLRMIKNGQNVFDYHRDFNKWTFKMKTKK